MAPSGELCGKGRCGMLAGKTAWSTPERLRGEVLTTRRYTNLRLPLSYLLVYVDLVSQHPHMFGTDVINILYQLFLKRRPNKLVFFLRRWMCRWRYLRWVSDHMSDRRNWRRSLLNAPTSTTWQLSATSRHSTIRSWSEHAKARDTYREHDIVAYTDGLTLSVQWGLGLSYCIIVSTVAPTNSDNIFIGRPISPTTGWSVIVLTASHICAV